MDSRSNTKYKARLADTAFPQSGGFNEQTSEHTVVDKVARESDSLPEALLSITAVDDMTSFDATELNMAAKETHEAIQRQALAVEKRSESRVQVRPEIDLDLQAATLETKEAAPYGSINMASMS